MNTTLKSLVAASLLTAASFGVAASDNPIQINTDVVPTGQFTGEDPAIYDLGQDLAVVFFYNNDAGQNVVVTTIAPKDPDSDRPASEYIVTLDEGEMYTATLASSDSNAPQFSDVDGFPIAQQ